jgi:hypothetical protein
MVRKTELMSIEGSKRAKKAIQAVLHGLESRSAPISANLAGSGALELKWTNPPDETQTTRGLAARSTIER